MILKYVERILKHVESLISLIDLDREPSPGGLCYGPHGPTRWSCSHIGRGACGGCMVLAAKSCAVQRQIERIRTVVIHVLFHYASQI